jgi:hypothetical protein
VSNDLSHAVHDARHRQLVAFSFALLLGLIALAAGGKAVLFDTLDPDLFWHLRVADQLQRQGVGPIVDELSYASVREPWTPYSWLGELLMRGAWQFGGFRAAVAIQAIAVALLVTLVAHSALSATRTDAREPRHFAVALLAAGGAFLMLPYLSFRPVLLALVLLAMVVYLLWRDREQAGTSPAVWLVPLLTGVMVNVHLYALLVPLVLTAMTLGTWVDERFRDRVPAIPTRRLAILTVCSALACCCTPMLPGVIETALHYQSADPMVAGGLISEMRPFWSGGGMGVAAACVAVVMLAILGASWRKLATADVLVTLLACVLLLRLGRFAPVFAVLVVPIAAAHVRGLSDRVLSRPLVPIATAMLLAVGLARVVDAFPSRDTTLDQWANRHAPDAAGYPGDAVAFMEQHGLKRDRVITEFTWGGYVAWRLAGDGKVLLDGRTQLYTADFWRDAYLGDAAATRRLLSRHGGDAAVVPAGKSRFRDALLTLGWTPAYRDSIAEVLLPPNDATVLLPVD